MNPIDLALMVRERDERIRMVRDKCWGVTTPSTGNETSNQNDFPLLPCRMDKTLKPWTDKLVRLFGEQNLQVYNQEGKLKYVARSGHYRMPAEWAEIYACLGKLRIEGEYDE